MLHAVIGKYPSLHGSTFYRGHIDTGQYNAADLLPKSITCRFNYLQIHATRLAAQIRDVSPWPMLMFFFRM